LTEEGSPVGGYHAEASPDAAKVSTEYLSATIGIAAADGRDGFKKDGRQADQGGNNLGQI
jgi:hypothetical protein